ncbi:hypothetical protein LOAG_16176 [Loa loa]|uniref:Uncharacterized protein n=1 Tax=Loa loa TaxID=7209 RepID=A0A1S0TEH2_LOALO|nr:hypothetical protein LOAG_16176 [Loa loa]EFO12357.1 hypothetical protein LOAG_16176 [Loa loa]
MRREEKRGRASSLLCCKNEQLQFIKFIHPSIHLSVYPSIQLPLTTTI